MTPKRVKPKAPIVVLDTSILMANASPWELDELRALGKTDYVIPSDVVWELDQLMTRTETRDRARSAINVLKQLTHRGAVHEPVTCGGGSTVRLASAEEVAPREGINLSIADDRILAAGLALDEGRERKIATTEFVLYTKALVHGLSGILLERYATILQTVTAREKESFRQHWDRLVAADSPRKIARRGLSWLQLPVVNRFLAPVRQTGEPAEVAQYLGQFDTLRQRWTGDLSLVLKPAFDLNAPTLVDDSVHEIEVRPWKMLLGVPYDEGPYGQQFPRETRRESGDERAHRIGAALQRRREDEEFIVDVLFGRLEVIREFILDQTGNELL